MRRNPTSVAISVVLHGAAQQAPVTTLPSEKPVTGITPSSCCDPRENLRKTLQAGP